MKDTIVAPVTGLEKTGVGIIRVSGIHVRLVIKKILNFPLKIRYAHYLPFFDNNFQVIDKGIALFFSSPYSFTGEDVLELQGHGNPFLLSIIIKNILLVEGVRLARPGEFSERAFLNGKINLIQAEAISDLINSQSELSAKYAFRSLQGYFSKHIENLVKEIKNFSVYLETFVNFEEHSLLNICTKKINFFFKNILFLIKESKNMAIRGSTIGSGRKIVIFGPPNTGKSSLFNKFLCEDVAIVTDVKGTTRDILKSNFNLNGFFFEIFDTAGIRKSYDNIENIGINKTYQTIKTSDHILFLLSLEDDNKKNNLFIKNNIKNLKKNQSYTIIFNKIDKVDNYSYFFKKNKEEHCIFYISVKKNIGIDLLKKHICKISGFFENSNDHFFLARQRHVELLRTAYKILIKAKKNWDSGGNLDCVLEDVLFLKKCIFEITGKFSHRDLLNRIFSEFCIGK